jgi:hypothetical protein
MVDDAPAFDPSKPFEAVSSAPAFDPSQPFEAVKPARPDFSAIDVQRGDPFAMSPGELNFPADVPEAFLRRVNRGIALKRMVDRIGATALEEMQPTSPWGRRTGAFSKAAMPDGSTTLSTITPRRRSPS